MDKLWFVLLVRQRTENFGHLADKFRASALYQGKSYERIDIVFDRYCENSIKESTRSKRTTNQRPIRKQLDDRTVSVPHDWANYMASPENKSDYADFLSTKIKKNAPYAKEMVTAGGFKDELEVWASCDNTDVSELS